MAPLENAGKTLFLFDVDGTLTKARQVITPAMAEFMALARGKVACGIVGGSDIAKISEQLGGHAEVMKFPLVFAENGLVAYKGGQFLARQSIEQHMGEQKLQRFINFALAYMAKLELPVKRGNFVEFRSGLINLCPVGRSCSQEHRDQFAAYDKEHKIREKFVEALMKEFPDLGLKFSIGGQISIDAFPHGWDKTYCLRFLEEYETIHFFGDKISPGGNDFEIFSHERTIGHAVTCPDDTRAAVAGLLGLC